VNLVLWHRKGSVWERKEGSEGDAWVLQGREREKGKRKGAIGWRPAIDGRRPSRKVGPGNDRGNERGGKAQRLIAKLLRVKDGKGGREERSGHGRSCGGAQPGEAEEKEGRKKGEGGLIGGARRSATAGKKEKEVGMWAAAGET
jgi:hypothetical protein